MSLQVVVVVTYEFGHVGVENELLGLEVVVLIAMVIDWSAKENRLMDTVKYDSPLRKFHYICSQM